MEEKFIVSKRGKTYYWVYGENNTECLVFCHGVTGDHTLFEKQVDFFSKKYKIINLDLPMHGKSRPYADFSYHNTAEDIHSIFLRENLENAVFVGQSLGGYACQAFYLEYPEKVRAFIAVDSTPFGEEYTTRTDRFWLRHARFTAMLCPYGYWIREGVRAAACTEESRENFRRSLMQYSKRELCDMYGYAYKDFLKYKKPVSMKCPVLLLLGEHDRIGSVAKYEKMWSQREGYPLKIIHGASHNSNFDNHTEFNQIAEEFLEEIRK